MRYTAKDMEPVAKDMEPVAQAINDLREKTGVRLILLLVPTGVPDEAVIPLVEEIDAKLTLLRQAFEEGEKV